MKAFSTSAKAYYSFPRPFSFIISRMLSIILMASSYSFWWQWHLASNILVLLLNYSKYETMYPEALFLTKFKLISLTFRLHRRTLPFAWGIQPTHSACSCAVTSFWKIHWIASHFCAEPVKYALWLGQCINAWDRLHPDENVRSQVDIHICHSSWQVIWLKPFPESVEWLNLHLVYPWQHHGILLIFRIFIQLVPPGRGWFFFLSILLVLIFPFRAVLFLTVVWRRLHYRLSHQKLQLEDGYLTFQNWRHCHCWWNWSFRHDFRTSCWTGRRKGENHQILSWCRLGFKSWIEIMIR